MKFDFYMWQRILVELFKMNELEISVSDLARRMGVCYQSILNACKILIEKDLVYKRMKISNKTPIRLTEKGKVIANNMFYVWDEIKKII